MVEQVKIAFIEKDSFTPPGPLTAREVSVGVSKLIERITESSGNPSAAPDRLQAEETVSLDSLRSDSGRRILNGGTAYIDYAMTPGLQERVTVTDSDLNATLIFPLEGTQYFVVAGSERITEVRASLGSKHPGVINRIDLYTR